MDDTTSTTPEGAATPVESTPAAQPRDDAGKFAPVAPTPAPEQGATTEAKAEAPAEAEAPKDEKSDEPKRNRARERIEQLTAEKYAERRRAEALERQLQALRQQPARQVDPDDYDAQIAERTRSVIREEQAGQTELQIREARARADEAQAQAFWAKVDDVRERIPNIDQSMQVFSRMTIPDDACEIIAESEVGAEMAHYLASTSEGQAVALRLRSLSPAQQGRELARIEARLTLPTRKVTAAPPPPPSVTGSGAPTQRTPAEMSIDEMQSMLKKSGVIR